MLQIWTDDRIFFSQAYMYCIVCKMQYTARIIDWIKDEFEESDKRT